MKHYLTAQDIAGWIPVRPWDTHKGNFGRLLCITGSRQMPGACLLSVSGALRCGAGLVTTATAPENPMRLAAAVPETMWLPLATDEQGFLLFEENRAALSEKLRAADAILMGCGLGRTAQVGALVAWVLAQSRCPAVLDADALFFAGQLRPLLRENVVITPHEGEYARFTGLPAEEIHQQRHACIGQAPYVTVLKGAHTVIAQGEQAYINPTGNPGMSRGGSGDVLAGMIAAWLAQGLAPLQAACIGVYLHGLAGDCAARRLTQTAMLPRDILAEIPQALRMTEAGRSL